MAAFGLFSRGGRAPRGGAPVLAFAAQKGGVGKTTSAVHVAWVLATEHHRRVLLVDLDAQGHVGAHLSAHSRVTATTSLGDCLLQRRGDLRDVAVPTDVENLHITNPDKNLHQVEIQLNARIGKEFVLDRALGEVRQRFDVIIVDCPPNLGNLTVAALLASDALVVPTDASRLALDGVADIYETLFLLADTFNRAPDLAAVLLTRVDRRSHAHNAQVRERLRELVGHDVACHEVPAQVAVARGQTDGTTVFGVSPDGAAAAAYRDISAWLLAELCGSITAASGRRRA